MTTSQPVKRLVIELDEYDSYRLLELVQNQAATALIWNDYWERVANEMADCLQKQTGCGFFQCAACTESAT